VEVEAEWNGSKLVITTEKMFLVGKLCTWLVVNVWNKLPVPAHVVGASSVNYGWTIRAWKLCLDPL